MIGWGAIVILAVGAYAAKAAGVFGGERLVGQRIAVVVGLLPAALFAALVMLQTFERDEALTIDSRLVGLLVAVVATWRRLPFLVVVLAAMAATAGFRLLV